MRVQVITETFTHGLPNAPYEFYHRRGDHDEEDLRDWLAAEQEILKGAAK